MRVPRQEGTSNEAHGDSVYLGVLLLGAGACTGASPGARFTAPMAAPPIADRRRRRGPRPRRQLGGSRPRPAITAWVIHTAGYHGGAYHGAYYGGGYHSVYVAPTTVYGGGAVAAGAAAGLAVGAAATAAAARSYYYYYPYYYPPPY